AQREDSETLVDRAAPDRGAAHAYRRSRRAAQHFRARRPFDQTPDVQERPFGDPDRKLAARRRRIVDEFVDHERRMFAERRLEARAISAAASIPEIEVRVDGQFTGLPGLRGADLRLNLVDSADSGGFRNSSAGAEDADGQSRRQSAD